MNTSSWVIWPKRIIDGAIDIELADAAVALGHNHAARLRRRGACNVAPGITVNSRALNFCSPSMVP